MTVLVSDLLQMTKYTPAWRKRRETGKASSNGDFELDVADSDGCDPGPAGHVGSQGGQAYTNDGYVHHREGTDTKM